MTDTSYSDARCFKLLKRYQHICKPEWVQIIWKQYSLSTPLDVLEKLILKYTNNTPLQTLFEENNKCIYLRKLYRDKCIEIENRDAGHDIAIEKHLKLSFVLVQMIQKSLDHKMKQLKLSTEDNNLNWEEDFESELEQKEEVQEEKDEDEDEIIRAFQDDSETKEQELEEFYTYIFELPFEDFIERINELHPYTIEEFFIYHINNGTHFNTNMFELLVQIPYLLYIDRNITVTLVDFEPIMKQLLPEGVKRWPVEMMNRFIQILHTLVQYKRVKLNIPPNQLKHFIEYFRIIDDHDEYQVSVSMISYILETLLYLDVPKSEIDAYLNRMVNRITDEYKRIVIATATTEIYVSLTSRFKKNWDIQDGLDFIHLYEKQSLKRTRGVQQRLTKYGEYSRTPKPTTKLPKGKGKKSGKKGKKKKKKSGKKGKGKGKRR